MIDHIEYEGILHEIKDVATRAIVDEFLSGGAAFKSLMNKVFPVYSIYGMGNQLFDPNTTFGGIWFTIEAANLRSTNTGSEVGTYIGADTKQITIANLPAHNHDPNKKTEDVLVETNEIGLTHQHQVWWDLELDRDKRFGYGTSGDNFGFKYSESSPMSGWALNTHKHNFTMKAVGSGTAFNVIPRSYVAFFHQRYSLSTPLIEENKKNLIKLAVEMGIANEKGALLPLKDKKILDEWFKELRMVS